jgi:hypothetical protein
MLKIANILLEGITIIKAPGRITPGATKNHV